MRLSQTVLLHRKLLNAGVEADLKLFEGMCHFFWEDPCLPLTNFFNRHLQSRHKSRGGKGRGS